MNTRVITGWATNYVFWYVIALFSLVLASLLAVAGEFILAIFMVVTSSITGGISVGLSMKTGCSIHE